MFDWDENNLRKIRKHRIKREEVEAALSNDPILIYEQRSEENSVTFTMARPTKGACSPL